MSLVCSACSGTNPPGAHFCNRCGRSLSATATRDATLRAVPVLFCDIVDSTALALRVDPEDLRTVFSEFRQLTRRFAAEHTGLRLRFIGDAARIVFGHPDVGEDAPVRALKCGLALASGAAEIAPAVAGKLAVRVGIAYGTVVLAHDLEETSQTDEAVVGSVPHLAARLAASAPAGGVLVDTAMRRLVGDRFAFKDLGPTALKGFDVPVRLWLAEGGGAFVSDHSEHRPQAPAFARRVGRERETARLREAWQTAAAGRGQLVALVGDPGVGKSLLANEIASAAVATGALRLDLDCTPRTTHSPLHPVATALRRLAGAQPSDTAEAAADRVGTWLQQWFEPAEHAEHAEHADVADYVARVLGAGLPTEGSAESAELVRQRTIGAMASVVGRLVSRSPLVVVVEDLQWADATTIEFLRQVRRQAGQWRVLAVVTLRPESIDTARALDPRDCIELTALDDADAQELMGALSREAGEALPAETVDWILKRAEGVPLFLEELTRSALEARGAAGAPGPLPATLQNVIQTRLDRRPALRALTQAAAVVGRECSLALLSELVGQPVGDLRHAIARLIDDGVLAARPDGDTTSLRFKHALIHEAVYATLLRSERDRLHLAAASSLGARLGEVAEATADTVAYHLQAARRHGEAAVWYLRASVHTNEKAAYHEAIGHARHGIVALDETASDAAERRGLRRQLLIQLGVAQSAIQGYSAPDVEQAYRQARELGPQADDEDDYPVLRGLATYHLVKGEILAAYERSREALDLSARSGRPDHRIDALCVHGYTSLYMAKLEECRTMLLGCLDLYRDEDGQRFRYPVPQDAATAAWALLPTAEWLLGRPADAEASIRSGLEHVERLDRPFDRALLHAWIAGTRYTQRRNAEALQHAGIAIQLSSQFGYGIWLAVSAIVAGLAEAALAPSPTAVTRTQQLLLQAQASGIGLNAPYYLWGLARGLVMIDQPAAAGAVIEQALQIAAASGERRMDSELLLLKAGLDPARDDVLPTLRAAFDLAIEQQALTTALRVALHAHRLAAGDGPERRRAANDLDRLDTGRLDDAEPDWVAQRTHELARHWPRAI